LAFRKDFGEKMMFNNRVNTIVKFAAVLMLFSPFGLSLKAQDLTGRPNRGMFGKETQAASQIDSINLQNGGVSLDVPLASLPPMAGGKLSYTLTAHYNSKLWLGLQSEVDGQTDQMDTCPSTYSTTEIMAANSGGWQIGSGYSITFRDAHEDYNFLGPDGGCHQSTTYDDFSGFLFKPILTTPDGSEHEMRIYGSYATYGGFRQNLLNFYHAASVSAIISSPTRFYTVDGSYLTAVVNPSGSSTRWTIYAKDGTKIEQTATLQTVTDPNGNSIEFGFNTTGGYHYARDVQTGRMIKWSASTYSGSTATKVEYQSVGGDWQTVWVLWGTTHVQGLVYYKGDWNTNSSMSCLDSTTMGATLDVIKNIIYPATESGVAPQEYIFHYNSDTSSSVTITNATIVCSMDPISYTRTTSGGLGQVSEIETPTGATINYAYNTDGVSVYGSTMEDGRDILLKDLITEKAVMHDGITDHWTYNIEPYGTSTVTNPDGSTYKEVVTNPNILYPTLGAGDGLGGLQKKAIQAGRILTEKHWTLLGGSLMGMGTNSQHVTFNPVVDTEYTTLLDTDGVTRLRMTAKSFAYDYNGDLMQTTEYDWINLSSVTYTDSNSSVNGIPTGIPSGTAVLRVTNNSYYNTASSSSSSTAYGSRTVGSSTVILGKPEEITVGTSSTVKSDTKFSYDSGSYGTAPTVGNLTKVSSYNDLTSSWIDASMSYDGRGNITSKTDGNGNVTQITYGSISGYSDLYPTQTIAAYGTGVARTTTAAYDFYTGLPTTTTDSDNGLTNATEYDILGRPVKEITASGDSTYESWTTREYHDHDRFDVVRSDLETKSDGKKVVTQFYDQLGRVRLAKTLEDASTQLATNETDGIKVETHYIASAACTFDTSKTCSSQVTSNPFRASSASAATSETTMGWTLSQTRNDGRHSEVETFGGAALPKPFVTSGYNTSTSGAVTTDIAVNATTVTDQAGKLRRSITNSLGQLVRVDEPNGSNVLGTVSSPNQDTDYTYDVLNNLLTVSQGSQTRTFTYSSLSRLLSAANPENGTISYGYDPNGNLTGKTDARSITTSYSYDALNRITQRSYSGESGYTTPTVTYTYDNVTNAKGKLTKVSSSVSATEYTSFDILGRVTGHKQTINSTDYTTGYTYNLSGALLTETYPSGRMVKNTLDTIGDLSQVETKPSGGSYATKANNFVYTAAGAASSLQLGNGKYETTQFNSRLQPTQIGLGTSTTDTSLLKLEFDYGTTANNGNVQSQTITVPGMTHPLIQAYTYDSLNRLSTATETSNSSQTWKQEFSYDRYGNRNFVAGSGHTTTIPSGCGDPVCNPTVSTSTNRLTSTGYSYDNTGNTTADAQGRTFTYDAENKQVLVASGGSTIGRYWYDGDGKRVKKTSSSDSIIFIYDAGGKLLEERDSSSGALQTSYTYAGSRLLTTETSSATNYLTGDHLGSPRINTDGSGNVTSRHDYHPFGEEIDGTGGRTTGLSYGSDSVRKQFTGYERDNEDGLDFAQARYLNSGHGRFTSPDPYNVIFEKEGAENEKRGKGEELLNNYLTQPQNWNRYVYVWNNPLRNTDPNGEKVYVVLYTTGNGEAEDELRRAALTKQKHIEEDGQFDPKKDKVLIRGVRTKADAQKAFDDAAGLEKDFGKIQQVQIFSHDDKDGPVFHPPGEGPAGGEGIQWSIEEVQQLRINWAPGAEAFFFGCQSAGFAQTFANIQGVTSWGNDRFAYFSSSRSGYFSPAKPDGPVYLVAADGRANGGYFEGVKQYVGYGKIYMMVKKAPMR
jgi:RHS repeat-associated protein